MYEIEKEKHKQTDEINVFKTKTEHSNNLDRVGPVDNRLSTN